MMDLLPEGTVAVVYAPSVKGLEDDVHRLMDAADKEPGEKPGVAELAQQLGVDPADLDMTRSAAVAVTMAPGSPVPVMTAILPVRDEKSVGPKLKAKMPEATVEAAGGYAAVTPEGPYKRGGAPAQLKGAASSRGPGRADRRRDAREDLRADAQGEGRRAARGDEGASRAIRRRASNR